MIRILFAAGAFTLFSGVALAYGHHGAPAPLLAAGVPAFLALGGGAAALRWFRNPSR